MNPSQPTSPVVQPAPAPQPDLSTGPQIGGPVQKPKSKMPMVIGIIIALVVIAAGAFAAWWWFTKDNTTPVQAAGAVTVTESGFEPATIKIKKGDDVTWTNQDAKEHQIYADQTATPNLDSQDPLTQGDSYSFTFEKEGTYHYYDSLNPTKMSGTVIVE